MEALTIKNLRKIYEGNLVALKGINLNVEEGDFFALLGPNGAGKTTTIGIISSLVTKTSGEVKVLGIDIDEEHSLAKKQIGVVGQEINFNQFEKVGQIIRNQAGYHGLSFRQSKENAEYFMKRLDIWDRRNDKARTLSGGLKRRIMVAKALVNRPKLLILDEPTAGVDIELRRSLWDFLVETNKELGTTIILTTHYLEEAERLCRNIAIIDKGDIIENSGMQELLARLEKETFAMDLDDPLQKVPQNGDFDFKLKDPKTLIVTVKKGQPLNQVFNFLSEQGIKVLSMRNETGRLEELFISLTESNIDKTSLLDSPVGEKD
ncbi:MAG: ABC transporter ATP-binding protein [SAR86 cluster bacterium]|jgi:ABC-2 type transport system ATP-binding protein|nr:ABC transporter ATP-binding protein [SAR86 cluster bacterium]